MPKRRRVPGPFDFFSGCDHWLDEREKAISNPVSEKQRAIDELFGSLDEVIEEQDNQTIEQFTKRGLTVEQVKRAMAIGGANLEFLQVVFDNHRKGLPYSVGVDVFLDRMEKGDDEDEEEEEEFPPVVK